MSKKFIATVLIASFAGGAATYYFKEFVCNKNVKTNKNHTKVASSPKVKSNKECNIDQKIENYIQKNPQVILNVISNNIDQVLDAIQKEKIKKQEEIAKKNNEKRLEMVQNVQNMIKPIADDLYIKFGQHDSKNVVLISYYVSSEKDIELLNILNNKIKATKVDFCLKFLPYVPADNKEHRESLINKLYYFVDNNFTFGEKIPESYSENIVNKRNKLLSYEVQPFLLFNNKLAIHPLPREQFNIFLSIENNIFHESFIETIKNHLNYFNMM